MMGFRAAVYTDPWPGPGLWSTLGLGLTCLFLVARHPGFCTTAIACLAEHLITRHLGPGWGGQEVPGQPPLSTGVLGPPAACRKLGGFRCFPHNHTLPWAPA